MAGEWLCHEGEVAKSMSFLNKGRLGVYKRGEIRGDESESEDDDDDDDEVEDATEWNKYGKRGGSSRGVSSGVIGGVGGSVGKRCSQGGIGARAGQAGKLREAMQDMVHHEGAVNGTRVHFESKT
jgi:hypothetical protein